MTDSEKAPSVIFVFEEMITFGDYTDIYCVFEWGGCGVRASFLGKSHPEGDLLSSSPGRFWSLGPGEGSELGQESCQVKEHQFGWG